jgi:hypothetical protein
MGKGEESPPDPEPFDGVPSAIDATGNRSLLYVGVDGHLVNEYDPYKPGCHRAFRLSQQGNGG